MIIKGSLVAAPCVALTLSGMILLAVQAQEDSMPPSHSPSDGRPEHAGMPQKEDLLPANHPTNQGRPEHPGTPPHRDPLAIYRATGINEDQEKRIRTMTKSFEEMMMEKGKNLVELMRDMRTLSFDPDPDAKTVLSKQDEINKLMNEMSRDRIQLMLKIRSILTSEQKQKLVQLMQQRTTNKPSPAAAGPSPEPDR